MFVWASDGTTEEIVAAAAEEAAVAEAPCPLGTARPAGRLKYFFLERKKGMAKRKRIAEKGREGNLEEEKQTFFLLFPLSEIVWALSRSVTQFTVRLVVFTERNLAERERENGKCIKSRKCVCARLAIKYKSLFNRPLYGICISPPFSS